MIKLLAGAKTRAQRSTNGISSILIAWVSFRLTVPFARCFATSAPLTRLCGLECVRIQSGMHRVSATDEWRGWG